MELLIYLFIIFGIAGLVISKMGAAIICFVWAIFTALGVRYMERNQWYSFPGDGVDGDHPKKE